MVSFDVSIMSASQGFRNKNKTQSKNKTRTNRLKNEIKNAIIKPQHIKQQNLHVLSDYKLNVENLKLQYPELQYEDNFEKFIAEFDFKSLTIFEKLVIEFLHNEKSHLKKLRILESVYFDFLRKFPASQGIVFSEKTGIPDLTDLIEFHKSLVNLLADEVFGKCGFQDLKFSEIIKTWMTTGIKNNNSGLQPRAVFRKSSIRLCKGRKTIIQTVNALLEICPEFKADMIYLENEIKGELTELGFDSLMSCQTQRITRYSSFIKEVLKHTSLNDKKERRQLGVTMVAFHNLCLTINSDIKLTDNKQNLIVMFNRLNYESILNCPECQKEWSSIDDIPKVDQLKLFSILKLKCLPDTLEIECYCYLFETQILLVEKDKNGNFSGLIRNFNFKTKKDRKTIRNDSYYYFPIVKLDESILITSNPMNNTGFYLVNHNKDQIFEFKANSVIQKNEWMSKLTEAKDNNMFSINRLVRKRLPSDIQRENEIIGMIRGCSLKENDKVDMMHFVRNLTGIDRNDSNDSGVFN